MSQDACDAFGYYLATSPEVRRAGINKIDSRTTEYQRLNFGPYLP